MFQEQFEELKHTGKLPTPVGVGLRILMLTRSEDCSIDDIVSTVQADPALSGRVLKLANSVLSAGVQASTTTREAAVRLGLRTVCNVALGFTLISGHRSGRCAAFDYNRYWSWSLASAVAAQRLASEIPQVSPAEAFTCALFARIGELALASVYPEEYARVLKQLEEDHSLDLAELEQEAFCIEHREVAAAMLEDWGLPAFFSEVVLHHDAASLPEKLDSPRSATLLRLLAVASGIAEVCLAEAPVQPTLWRSVREEAYELGLEPEDFQRIYDEIGARWKEWGALLSVPADFRATGRELEGAAATGFHREAPELTDARAPLRILAVDDDPVSLKLLVLLLERNGHQVHTAQNGRAALALALEEAPQMVITDWLMPEMDGLELCKRLRSTEAGRDLYILVLTGRGEEERIVEAFEAGADDYIVKPVSSKLLLARIRPGQRVIHLQEKLLREVQNKEDANRRLSIERRKFKVASMTDALTELPNRRYAMKRLENEWAASVRAGVPLSLILLDLDHFKEVNDQHGHDVGDLVLRSTARAIKEVVRRSDTCARLGGEEFLVICPGTAVQGAFHLAERIRAAIEANQAREQGFDGRVTASLGVSTRSPDTDSISTLLKAADEAVYLAKNLGRNRVEIAPSRDSGRRTA